jgi:hypothetical protein
MTESQSGFRLGIVALELQFRLNRKAKLENK